MDRRQRKTREAVFKAFTELLSEKNVNHITVGDIIDRADIGRATFYAHFETKDYLLKELCEELFCHVFDTAEGNEKGHKHIFDCDGPDSVFLHLFQHLERNDNNILDLISCRNNELFRRYFKEGLVKLIESRLSVFADKKSSRLPKDFLVNHIAVTFTETVVWWAENGMKQSPEQIYEYFMLAV